MFYLTICQKIQSYLVTIMYGKEKYRILTLQSFDQQKLNYQIIFYY